MEEGVIYLHCCLMFLLIQSSRIFPAGRIPLILHFWQFGIILQGSLNKCVALCHVIGLYLNVNKYEIMTSHQT